MIIPPHIKLKDRKDIYNRALMICFIEDKVTD